MNLTEKSAYIKGLAEGLEYDKTTKEGKIIAALLDLVNDMALEIADLQKDIEEIDEDLNYLDEYVEELDDDLQDVEDYLDAELDEDDLLDDEWDDEDEDYEDGEYFEIECPSCGETVCFDEELDPEELICPACGEKFDCSIEDADCVPTED